MRLPIFAAAMLLAGLQSAAAQDAHTTHDALACANPRAVRALSNQNDPRRSDPNWVNFVVSDGHCVTLRSSNRISPIGVDGELTRATAITTTGRVEIFVRTADLAAPVASAPPMPAPLSSGDIVAARVSELAANASPAAPGGGAGTAAYSQGMADRAAWEAWYSGLSGDRHNGATYWVGHRSLPNPGQCAGADSPALREYTLGCVEARARLAPFDVRRKSDPQYRLGWNTPVSLPLEGPVTPIESGSVPASTPLASAGSFTADAPQWPRDTPSRAASAVPVAVQPMAQLAPPPVKNAAGDQIVPGGAYIFLFIVAVAGMALFMRNSGNENPARSSNHSGILSGLLGCVFGVLGIFTIGIVFVPLAAVCSIIGILSGISGGNLGGVFVSLLGVSLTIAGFVFSPSLWLLLAAVFVGAQH